MNYRPSAWLREAHDDGRCPDACPLCQRIEDTQDVGSDDRDHTIHRYPEGWQEP